ncbi:response regulator [Neptunicella marina]|uniref:Response regulator n=1 Tax=Neptunicella marina TaxID=2125989 RepID=A0A8J6M0G8_9ALTE|nr:response regulator [Neptunicella marina]MBC3767154.1 response regulator [Neptunicella marina]
MDRNLAKNSNVLIIDEQVLAQGYMKYALQELGFEKISYVEQADKALNRIQAEEFDLIICSYHLKKEQEGYSLYEYLISERIIPESTAFVFISSETNADIVQSIIELQPDEFLVKPFTVNDISRRLTRILKRKKVLKDIYQLMHKDLNEQALDAVETFLTSPDKSEFFPIALKLKGELLLLCEQYEQAKEFYQAIINVQNFAWAQLGMVKSLMALDQDDEAEKLLLRLAFKADAQVKAFDLLADIQIKQKDFDMALESTLLAAELSPRNIKRHQYAMQLSRLTHDHQTLFEISKKVVRYARNSVYEQPQIYLNAARAGIDYAMTAGPEQCNLLLKQCNEYLKRFNKTFPKAQMSEPLKVIHARMHYLQDEKHKAEALLNQLDDNNWSRDSMEDLLDKAKAFHEIGLYEKSMRLLNEIERRCRQYPDQGKIFLRYILQEKQERHAIRYSPKELNNAGVSFYQTGDIHGAMKIFRQAFRVMPKNPAIALNLLQAIALRLREQSLTDNIRSTMKRCIYTIENSNLTQDQEERYQKVTRFFEEVA